MQPNRRLLSLDTLRGFDMFWIMGAQTLVIALATACNGVEPLGTIAQQMRHVDWDGFRFYDMIFPLFLFIAGISFPFSRLKAQDGVSPYPKIIRRGLTLFVLGMVYNGLFYLDFENLRIFSVLGRIGLAWMFGAIIYVSFRQLGRIIWCVAILVGYWLLLALCVAPDATAGVSGFSYQGNIVGYIDRVLFGDFLYTKNFFDPEGFASTLPAISTTLLGMFAGEIVLANGKPVRKLIIFSVALIVIGLLWNFAMPINKKLWSSSFVCFVGGLSMMLFTLFYWIIDVKGWSRWTLFFRVIGMNSITIYMAVQIVGFGYISKFFVSGIASKLPQQWSDVVNAAGYLTIAWLFLWFLYRKKIFLKI